MCTKTLPNSAKSLLVQEKHAGCIRILEYGYSYIDVGLIKSFITLRYMAHGPLRPIRESDRPAPEFHGLP